MNEEQFIESQSRFAVLLSESFKLQDKVRTLESQLAEQTERVRVMREAAQFLMWKSHRLVHQVNVESNEMYSPNMEGSIRKVLEGMNKVKQALNQESLGDGGKGE